MILRKNFVGYIVNGGRRAIRGVIALRFFILSALNFFCGLSYSWNASGPQPLK